ncbi:UDP-N-acetylglucosamine transferase subunit ALG13 -like protein [Toxocara canis]|uniref:UDP-N-acetylglucosamine transferase subunit ALG13-like protein n=1 Tax=Toxocara canis TaxID=6265 RepID=A0A0B2VQT5_TOXCA|nr:UDP-N-acetylglucosamine transferase subunit ALG13 -like protein [Toxocara canis]
MKSSKCRRIQEFGAGTCLEALRLSKIAFIVINEDLMGNHQRELAERLAALDHIVCTTAAKLVKILETADVSRLKPFVPCDLSNVVRYINRTLGIVDNS